MDDQLGGVNRIGRRAADRLSLPLPIPEWLVLGHTRIVEVASGERHFAMDFRLTHPLFGQVFRYAGKFEAVPDSGGAS